MTTAELAARLLAANACAFGATFLGALVTVQIAVRSPHLTPVSVTGEGATLDAAVADALRKVGA